MGSDSISDADPLETGEWIESIESVMRTQGPDRARFIVDQVMDHMRRAGADMPYGANTAYLNTIPASQQPAYPGNEAIEKRIAAYLRWNAMAMVVQANRESSEYGGHIASYASAATLYEVGFNHFWRGSQGSHRGDMIFIQGHSSPGIYARSFLEGRLTEAHLRGFRREVSGGLSSYPHPWLMPDYWQFPTVSMGLGPMMAIMQARFTRYMEHRGLIEPSDRRVWCFLGDGEMDEPESLGAIDVPVRENLNNLIFVINCNLQRLDGPVRGNGKIVQELEAIFRGAGWNVLKVLWGSRWDPLLQRDTHGVLQRRMEEAVDGEYQAFKSNDGAYVREHFFGKYPELAEMVAKLSDEEIWRLNRGGHDRQKVYAAYKTAVTNTEGPTVILAKTVKGFGMGKAGEGLMTAHQAKKLDLDAIRSFRDRFDIPVPDDQLADVPFCRLPEDSNEAHYLAERRKALSGPLPIRITESPQLKAPPIEAFETQLKSSGTREISTTMALVRIITSLLRDKQLGKHLVPIVPDEARTFGMEGLFRQIGIYSSKGQLYTPQDADQLMYYREDKKGQILQEGINEAGAFCSWIAAATSYANHGESMIPFYIFYSMFGFQRIGDFAWAAGDMQARGFLIGGTAGRTTLAGEGLQHQDGHSLLAASTIPNCVAYDPTYAYELAVIVRDGLLRMFEQQENVYYYITCMNENYTHPAMPKDSEEGILRGMYRLREGGKGRIRVQLLGAGAILREVIAAAELLEAHYDVPADVWSVTSFNRLRREGLSAERWNRLHPGEPPRRCWTDVCLDGVNGPFIAATDYMKIVADQIRPWVPGEYVTLGTDGYGRSDGRAALRQHFEVDRHHIVVTALKSLADEGTIEFDSVKKAMGKYGIDPDRPNPVGL
ncbi:MAG: pyruvate dehydrogenase (acetyl-transferring), homodimeric type [Gammaproteobacteria bacterium]|nr:pyruvate dehydrogenase (acetyl-transferring), homodimeric type [Gammaproteobacteria bacterium]